MRVFVNYRREDTRHVAGWLRDILAERYGAESVFIDVRAIHAAEDYVVAIERAVNTCDVLVVLIGDRWLNVRDAQGNRRIDKPKDRVRLEIETALQKGIPVLPVVVDTASMPQDSDLPTSLAPLSRRQAVRLRYESFRADAERMLADLERLVGTGAAALISRWAAFGLLVAAVLALLVFRDDLLGPLEQLHKLDQSQREAWLAVIWLLPAVPIVAAALLVALNRHLGVAAGLLAAATVSMGVLLVRVQAIEVADDTVGKQVLPLILVLSALVALVAASRDLRSPLRLSRSGNALVAAVLVVAAMGLRAWHLPTWSQNRFWLALLVPIVVSLPGAVLRGSPSQSQAMITFGTVGAVYGPALRVIDLLAGETERRIEPSDVTFFLAAAFMIAAVWVGQRSRDRS